ncbi:protein FAR-RED IMPAIRED RESPONSE 1 [Rhodamnia argentea]|uniref:Protein FAR1-RELATED SEQUENCE n=1 Tax=Rhodamnia argentea TaxID=178133 RepID=A0A8B8QUE3_9MYRT|nr:protein FAR-RED IMPAIRED RESPONSE 1 [Rhodamnia argentea]XP_030550661.1 protein FAR-RED IMPAIRED RESPONSE 1 [Rhodamnia argentea]XP_048141642.1 protein FAR-RED IMPAIRED RESPONSE 1 [Rhodamnia argentea]XP_048141643.1 protein FAR-RED IMPAIRED RESPONSE 1 [Rhodamnia argentea]XP_048141644.1 protein FAR-RED IMPAIRED RESPONSE 1 [Rhodamnia argentea]
MGIDLEQFSGECQKEATLLNTNGNTIHCCDEGHVGDGYVINPPVVSEVDREKDGPNWGRRSSDNGQKNYATEDVKGNSSTNTEPHDGMEFESKEEAFSFYREHAKSAGFTAIIKASRRSRISGKFIDAKFACTRYGNKREPAVDAMAEPISTTDIMAIPVKKKRGRTNQSGSKTDCKAGMHVKRMKDGRWVIHSLIKEHNHEIFPDDAYFFRCHGNSDQGESHGDTLHAIHARTKMYVSMTIQSGGYKKLQSQKGGPTNQLKNDQHLRLDEGDTQLMLDHFMFMQDQNPNFFYAVDLNPEQRLRNVFWVDAKGRIDYGNFGDVVFFDTTYIKSEYRLPFAPFIGVNHHSQSFLLGCAFLADETKSTYVWLMQAWRRAMGGRAPQVILTDQEKALKEAIAEVLPESRHCFCLWQILSKVPEKVSCTIKQDGNFMKKFNKCISESCTAEQFEKRWRKMVDRFNLRDNSWLLSTYEDRHQWAPTYMKDIFLAGMSTVQRSDSTISFLDKHMQRKTTFKEFLEQYKTMLQEKYEEEAKADFETWHKQPVLKSPSPFGKQMAATYTHAVFKKFQVEVVGVVACHPRQESEDGDIRSFKVQDFEENRDLIVVLSERTLDISCSCRSFELNGFLCRHAMIVLQISGVHSIPSEYVLRRWTKDAKSIALSTRGSSIILPRIDRYNDLCQQAFKLGDEGSLSQESYAIASAALEEALRKCESITNSAQSTDSNSPPHGLQELEVVNRGNRTSKKDKKYGSSKEGEGPSSLEAPALECYNAQESMQGTIWSN